ncbi:PIG-L family deacetylase [Streptomyces sp. R1]|uniref:PIG-L family deacetylase n=1 Tax=Streptomyces sp. R1 TaxID=1509279 RepID=UPI001E467B6B|nr:PIG-L family deacetylase [Streptomyces sp. R1]MCC8337186.1 PIG-L family deacetylase [Streptomyces sp. R1]
MTQPTDAHSTSVFQVFAHPDDDLYFANPDLTRLLAGGHRVTSVYLTAAEADGRNVDTRDPLRDRSAVDFEGYTEARQNGLRAAYATMVLGKREASWVREAVELVPGVVVERCYMSEAPGVQLFFLGLRMVDAAHGFPADQPPVRLTSLWDGRAAGQPTLVGRESPLRQVQLLGREEVVSALVQLLGYVQPTLMWTMDPDPLHESFDEARGITSSDHADHTATAQFALEALRRHLRAGGRPPLTEHFTGYGNKVWPNNLSERSYTLKKRLIDVYAGADGHPCTHRYCGDLQLGDGADIRRYGWSTRSRYPQGTQWLHLQADGRLAAYAVLGDQAAVWTEAEAGAGRFEGPLLLPGGGLLPCLAVAPDRTGGVHLVGLRRTMSEEGRVDVEVVRMWRQAHTGSVLPWESFGNPDEATRDWRRCREVGVPAAVVDPAGHLHVFVRNFSVGVSMRRETAEGLSLWEAFGGRWMQDTLTTVLRSTGRIDLYATNRTGGVRWRQEAVYGPFKLEDQLVTSVPETWRPVSGLTPVQIGRNRMALFYREEDTGAVMRHQQRPNGTWEQRVERLSEDGGTGAVAAARLQSGEHDVLVIARRDEHSRPTVAVLPMDAHGEQWPDWQHNPVQMIGAPAVGSDVYGRAVVTVLGADGRLHWARLEEARPGVGFGAWQAC